MAKETGIAWTDSTFNPWRGCMKVSEGCKNYSGTAVIYKGRSTGKLSSEGHSDGWFFTEQGTNHLIRVSGACVVTQRTSSSPVLPPIDSTCCGLLK